MVKVNWFKSGIEFLIKNKIRKKIIVVRQKYKKGITL